MKKIVQFFLVFMLIGVAKISSASSLDEMNPVKRDSILLVTAKRAVMKYGPGYYRDYKHAIERTQIKKEKEVVDVYLVTYFYDQSKETLEYNYAAQVTIKVKTGLVTRISFGNGLGFSDLDQRRTRNSEDGSVIRYQAVKPNPETH